MDANKLIRSTATHDYYVGPLGEISVPKLTRQCTVCKKRDVLNMDIGALRELHAIDERKLAATARRPYAIGISTITERVERNRALLSRLEKDRS